ncbi:SusD/RagB family nutrient-binding outer membrane lipoprotein [Hymenobacter qilianensis]|nr:SusD/RagB family nutrient-binding outer membrane lipoprotein [Hymenobacter qilianensis]
MESLFLQAEAAERGWLATATARSLYEAAIRESFLYLEVPAAAAAVATYLAQPTVRYDQAPNKLERLITQKWLALNSISSIEAWNDYRRLGFPAALPNSPQAPSPTARPLRLLYPETERTTNGPEVGKQGSLDGLTDKVWWDQ